VAGRGVIGPGSGNYRADANGFPAVVL
jgi:hypothetical protein